MLLIPHCENQPWLLPHHKQGLILFRVNCGNLVFDCLPEVSEDSLDPPQKPSIIIGNLKSQCYKSNATGLGKSFSVKSPRGGSAGIR